MKLSLNWIKDYVKLPGVSVQELAHALTMATVEVEGVVDQAEQYRDVVVGRVVEIVQHPRADRLRVCRVDVQSEILQIICGGTNLAKDMLVAVAKVGSRVQWHGKGEPIALSKAKIRGLESYGMIASANEIGLGRLFPQKKEREILDLSVYDLKVGEPLAEALGMTDSIFDIDNKSMTHRPDLWSQYGLAREVSAIFKSKLKPLSFPKISRPRETRKTLTAKIWDAKLCSRYAAVVLQNITPTQSPWWLRRDLESVGVGTVNSIVDATNYVMMSLGQPLHAFDYDSVAGHTIVVQPMGKNAPFEAINKKTYSVGSTTLMIKDEKKPIAIAGVMGGKNSEITHTSTSVIIESANFSPISIRRSSLALGLRTESSSRFEKSLDPTAVMPALQMAVELLLTLHPGAIVASPVIDQDSSTHEEIVFDVAHDFLFQRIGVTLSESSVLSILKRLGFGVTVKRGIYTVAVPWFRRHDVSMPEDIVEEVARIDGYARIAAAMPRVELTEPMRNDAPRLQREIKHVLTTGFGYDEVPSYSFADATWSGSFGSTANRLMVKDSLHPELRYLRTSLIPQLMARAAENLRWYDEFKIFELGRVFLKQRGEYRVDASSNHFLPKQPTMLAGLYVSRSLAEEKIYFSTKGTVEGLLAKFGLTAAFVESKRPPFSSRANEVLAGGKPLGRFGLVKRSLIETELRAASVAWWELEFSLLQKFARFTRSFQKLPKYPSMTRDVAILVDESVRWADVQKIAQAVSSLMSHCELFDVFTSPKLGPRKKSLAFTLTFSSPERTLEAKEVDEALERLMSRLQKALGAIQR